MPTITPAKDLPPKPLQAGQAIVLCPWHLGHKVLVGIARPLSSNNTEGKRGRDYTYGGASVNRFINRRPRSRLTIRQRTRVLKEWPPAREVLLPSTTNEILEAVASQQINKIGHRDDFTMRAQFLKTQQQTSECAVPQQRILGDAMTELLALSVSVAVLGGIWAFIALGPLGGFALVWVGFIAAGCFFAAGGDIKALSKTIVGMIYGAIVAWIALLIIAKVPVPGLGTVWPAIVVGVTVFFLVIVASTDLLSCVPANVYGYAALVGYTLSAGKLDVLTVGDNSNPLFLIVISSILGAVLGYLMGQLAGVLKPRPGRADTSARSGP